MVRSLWTAASGMNGQQFNIDTISHNLSNVNTDGYKKVRAEFEDLLYQTRQIAGSPATEDTVRPTGIQVGHGVKAAATQRMFLQGSPRETGNSYDMAISGEGFFRVLLQDNSYGYSRNGAFKIDANGQMVDSNGHRLLPEIYLPQEAIQESLSVDKSGRITVKLPESDDPVDIGQIQLFRFINPAGLSSIGENIYKITNASGEAIGGRPGFDGIGQIYHKFLESSNVSAVEEMVNMIVAQRAYEMSSKAIQTTDNMLGVAASLKR